MSLYILRDRIRLFGGYGEYIFVFLSARTGKLYDLCYHLLGQATEIEKPSRSKESNNRTKTRFFCDFCCFFDVFVGSYYRALNSVIDF